MSHNKHKNTEREPSVEEVRTPVHAPASTSKRTKETKHKNTERESSVEEVTEIFRGRTPVYTPARTSKRTKDKFTLDISQILDDKSASRHLTESPSRSKIATYENAERLRTARRSIERSPSVYVPRSSVGPQELSRAYFP